MALAAAGTLDATSLFGTNLVKVNPVIGAATGSGRWASSTSWTWRSACK
jgi:hypothetical protein